MFQWNKLKADKTSADWARRVPELETAIESANAKLASLEERRGEIVLSGDEAAIGKFSADVAAAREDVANLTAALAGAKKRHEEAAHAEAYAEVKAIYDEGQKYGKACDAAVIRARKAKDLLEKAATEYSEAMKQLKEARRSIDAIHRRDYELLENGSGLKIERTEHLDRLNAEIVWMAEKFAKTAQEG